MIGSSRAKILRTGSACRELGLLGFKNGSGVFWRRSEISFGRSSGLRSSGVRLTLKAVQTEAIPPQKISRPRSVSFFVFFFLSLFFGLIFVNGTLICMLVEGVFVQKQRSFLGFRSW